LDFIWAAEPAAADCIADFRDFRRSAALPFSLITQNGPVIGGSLLGVQCASRFSNRWHAMNVLRFPLVPMEPLEDRHLAMLADERLPVVAKALARVDSLLCTYRQVGARPNPETILMMIAAVLENPELRRTAGIDLPVETKF